MTQIASNARATTDDNRRQTGCRTSAGHVVASQRTDPSARQSSCCCSGFCRRECGREGVNTVGERDIESYHLQDLQVTESLQRLFVHTRDLVVVKLQGLDGGDTLEDTATDGVELVVGEVTAGVDKTNMVSIKYQKESWTFFKDTRGEVKSKVFRW